MKILVAGASGFIGAHFIHYMQSQNHAILKLSRSPEKLKANEIYWDPQKRLLNPFEIENIDAVVNFAGENIASSRWTDEKKRKILESRVNATKTLEQAVLQLQNPPKVWINASAIGFYGNRGDHILTEESSSGKGFLAEVCQKWEQETQPASLKGIRVVLLRIGMVLSSSGGGLAQMLPAFKLGLGGTIGSGKQFISWIALDELMRIIDYAINHDDLKGPVNAVSPQPVTNDEFTKTLGRIIHRPTILPLPAFAARIVFGEMADELLLSSARAMPKSLIDSGYKFIYPDLDTALRDILTAS